MQDRDRRRPTLKTVAELTGLSLSTVSLSLRDGASVKKATRDKVMRAAEEVGYVPNRAGVRLRTGRTNVLALILSADANSIDFTRLLIQGIGGHISDTRFHLNVIPEIGGAKAMAAIRYVLANQAADGVILTHTSARDPRVRLLMEEDFPFVCHGRTEFYTPHPFHDFHVERYVERAVARLVEKGRRTILLAAVDNGTTNYANLVGGFNRAVAGAGLVGDVFKDAVILDDAAAARALGKGLAERPDRYDAIITNSELTALAIISGMRDEGLILGRDYDLICKQTTEILPTLYPEIDTLAEDLFASGAELAKLLIRRIDGCAPEALQTLHEPIPRWRAAL